MDSIVANPYIDQALRDLDERISCLKKEILIREQHIKDTQASLARDMRFLALAQAAREQITGTP